MACLSEGVAACDPGGEGGWASHQYVSHKYGVGRDTVYMVPNLPFVGSNRIAFLGRASPPGETAKDFGPGPRDSLAFGSWAVGLSWASR